MPRKSSVPTVGKSYRTVAKHAAMDKQLGREVSVDAVQGRTPYLFDLCAGDGQVAEGEEWKRHCSPGLVAWHLGYKPPPGRRWQYGSPEGVLIEKQLATYERLLSTLAEELPKLRYPGRGTPWRQVSDTSWVCIDTGAVLNAIHADSSTAEVYAVQGYHAAYVLQDPNAATHWPMRRGFIAEIRQRTWWCLSMSTLGCNANGHKAWTSRSIREGWLANVNDVRGTLSRGHSLYLARIERDAHQWAYLFEVPAVWRTEIETDVAKAFGRTGLTVEGAWHDLQREAFDGIMRRLVFTKPELEADGT